MANKVVIVINDQLDRGVAANIIGLLGISIGHHVPSIVGPQVVDSTGRVHRGMSTMALPVLAANTDALKEILIDTTARDDLFVFDVTDAAVASKDYESYTQRLQDPETDWSPLGVAVFGPRRQVDRLTGRLGLLR